MRRAYGHRPTGLTWAMAWVGTAMMPLAVRTLMASAGPLTIGPHQAWPVVPVTATAGLLAGAGHQPDSAAITARIKATMVSRIPARSRAVPPAMARSPSRASPTG